MILAGKEIVLIRLTGLYREDKDREKAGVEGEVARMRQKRVLAVRA